MKSRTKIEVSNSKIEEIFTKAQLAPVLKISALSTGEYNSVYAVETPSGEYVLKVAPKPETPVLTYEKYMMRSEIFWYEQMTEKTKINVPAVRFSDFSKTVIDSDYFIMDKLNGTQLNHASLSAKQLSQANKQVVRCAAELHKVKNDRFGYIQNGLYDTWYEAYTSFIKNLLTDCERVGKRSKNGEKVLKLAEKYKDALNTADCCLVNFDLWAANIFCKKENDGFSYSLIDPERSFWGDRVCEFINFEYTKSYKNKTASFEAYNEVSVVKLTADENEIIRYAFAGALAALIMETEKYYRYTPLHFGWWRNVAVSTASYKSAFKVLK